MNQTTDPMGNWWWKLKQSDWPDYGASKWCKLLASMPVPDEYLELESKFESHENERKTVIIKSEISGK